MTATFRAEPVMNCVNCQYSIDWSSGGISCQKTIPSRTITGDTESGRMIAKTATPNWCPLPLVKFNDN